MPRRPRFATGGYVFHVLNRAASRRQIFDHDADYDAFERVLQQVGKRVPMRVLAFCLMPNHWHLLLWPSGDEDLSEYMRWLQVTHTQRWNLSHGTTGLGPLYQGRFKSFPVEADDHFYTVCRYVERNALRANLVSKAENWRWGSLWQTTSQNYAVDFAAWPVPRPSLWTDHVNAPQSANELTALRECLLRGRPYGNENWQRQTARLLGLEKTLRPLPLGGRE